MNKSKFFNKFLKKINTSINSQLEKNLNRLKFNNLITLAKSNKIILTFVALFVLFVSYLLMPAFYKQSEISRELKADLLEKFNLEFQFSKDLNYNFFPRPHFIINDTSILFKDEKLSNIEKLKIFIKLKNFFSVKNVDIKDIIIEKANFNLNKENSNFFNILLTNDFQDNTLAVKDSNIFFRNLANEVLFINKIKTMKYYYEVKELKNIVKSKNEIFNIPYEIKIFNFKNNNKVIFSELDVSLIKLKIENKLSYSNSIHHGIASLNYNKFKSAIEYETNKNFFKFNYYDKLENPKFKYEGNFNFQPFYSFIKGNTKKLNLSYLLDANSLISKLIKTELFNNKNIDFKLDISAEDVYNNFNFKNIKIKSKIREGLIDIDQTNFNWQDSAKFYFTNSLIFLKDGELVLDGNLSISIKDYDEIYKFLLTPKFYRKKIQKIDLNFEYNFDQNTANLKDIKIDNVFNENINRILKNVVFKKNNLQNRIYFKNIINKALKNYEG